MERNLIVGLIKKYCIKWVNNFLDHVEVMVENVKVELDLSSYATKADLM